MKYSLLFLSGLLISACGSDAQMLKPVAFQFPNENRNNFTTISSGNLLTGGGSKGLAVTTIESNSYLSLQEYNLKYTLPKGAIFCRMEDAIYSHLNFWVKFRMGTDDKYSN